MKPVRLDSLAVTAIAAALVVWTSCLTVLWGWAFDTSCRSTLVTLAATMLAVSLAAPLPGRVARIVQTTLAWRRPQDVLQMALASASGGRRPLVEARAKVRLVCASAVVAVACGLASTGAIFGGAAIARALAASFLWDQPAWIAAQLLIQLVGMLPMGFGLSVAFLAGSILRGAGPDAYAPLCRDWLWGIAVGLAVFGGCWWAGASLVGVSLATAFALLAGAVGMFLRREPTIRPRRAGQALESPPPALYLGVLGGWAVFAFALLVQMRALADLAGAGLPARAGWAGLSLGLLAVFVRTEDRKSRPPSLGQSLGAAIGVSAGLLMQLSLAIAGAAARSAGGLCAALAAGQVPLAALGAVVISRQRRLFAKAGGRARHYLAGAAGGAGAACLAYLAIGSLRGTTATVLAAGMAFLAGAAVWAVRRAARRPGALKWAAWSTVLMLSAMGAVAAAAWQFGESIGSVTPGVWLSSLSAKGDQAANGEGGCLPAAPGWRSAAISEIVADLMAGHQGRWWIVASGGQDMPSSIPRSVLIRTALPDPTAVGAEARRDLLLAGREDFLLAARMGGEVFDGIGLSPLPADHPDAWRCYNDQVLRRCRQRVAKLDSGGMILLRTQADGGRIGAALAVARTFREVVGPGWAGVAFGEGRIDLLLAAGGMDVQKHFCPRGGVFVAPIGMLWRDWDDVRALRLVNPAPAWTMGRPTEAELRDWLAARKGAVPE